MSTSSSAGSSGPDPVSGLSEPAAASARGVLAATCLSTLIVNANTSAVSILLPAISADTGMDVTTLQWAVTGYSLVGAAVIVTSGSLGDVFGRKRVFQLGLLLFVVSCVFIGLSSSGGAVIAGRFVQGAAGATILACGLSLLSVANSGQEQLRAVSLWGAAAAVGAAAGPLLGGVLVEVTGWQGLFWVGAAVAAACMFLTWKTVTESKDDNRSRSIDFAGSGLIALTLGPVILALSKGSAWGWVSPATIGCLAVGVAAGFAFVVVEKRVAVPMLDLALLRNRVLVGSTVAILIGAGTINGLMYLVSLYFQDPATLGFSPAPGGAGHPARHGRARRGGTTRAAPGQEARRPPGDRHRLPHHGDRLRGRRSRRVVVGVRRVRPPAHRDRRRHGVEQRPVVVGVDRVRARRAGRLGVRCLEHGALRRRGSRHRAGRDDLRRGDRGPHRAGASTADALAAGLGAAAWVMAAFSVAGVVMAVVMGRHPAATGTLDDSAAAAAAHTHTLPTSATARVGVPTRP